LLAQNYFSVYSGAEVAISNEEETNSGEKRSSFQWHPPEDRGATEDSALKVISRAARLLRREYGGLCGLCGALGAP